jgi:DNA-binding NtrC family response regulator
MSSAATWGGDSISTADGAQLTVPVAEAALNYRLKALKEVARALLRELDSLTSSQIQDKSESVRLYDEVQRFESALIRHALGRSGGSQTRAAKMLGVKLTTLNTKIKRYKISRHESDGENNLQNQESVA